VGLLQRLARTDVRVAHALLSEVSDRVRGKVETLGGTAFGTLRQRVVQHLLDVAADQQRDGVLVARLSQQELADHVGRCARKSCASCGSFATRG
jgi:hypothetical protein